jgi:tyrosinase
MPNLQSQIDGVLSVGPGGPAEAAPPRMFSAFHLPDVYRANVLASEWMQIAEEARNGGGGDTAEAVAAVLDAATTTAARMTESPEEDPELARHALKLFLTHYRHGLPLQIKGIEARTPHLILPSKPVGAGDAAAAAEANPEERLLWLREDPKLNEHHEHWHVVYPLAGVPAPGLPLHGKVKERQGELFLYMHRQMVARYDTERLAVGLDRVVRWGYRDSDPYGYDPGQFLRKTYPARAPGLAWERTNEGPTNEGGTLWVDVDDMECRGDRLFEAAAAGVFDLPDGSRVPVDAHLLGLTQEADIGSVEADVLPFDPSDPNAFQEWYNSLTTGYYGNFHNVGHDMFGYLSRGEGKADHNGVMGFVPTAMRDHVFYRWHKVIDDLYATWQDTQPSHDFSTDVPPVVMRKSPPDQPIEGEGQSPDVILCLKKDLVPWDRWGDFGRHAFGGDSWDRDFASGTFDLPGLPTPFTTTGELQTSMHRRVVTIETGAEPPAQPKEDPHEIEYLDQEEFFYFFRLENTSDQPQDVTVRVFLVALEPEEIREDRRMWIEMDKFKHSLKPRQRDVVWRPAELASVIRKPAVKPPKKEHPPVTAPSDPFQEDSLIRDNYCDCGWPYNLLLPRGTREGMPFRIMVMLTDWSIDNVESGDDCGSMSYCGARDRYPDSRPMGYPFDAPFRDRSIGQTIAEQPNMATRDVVIRWV